MFLLLAHFTHLYFQMLMLLVQLKEKLSASGYRYSCKSCVERVLDLLSHGLMTKNNKYFLQFYRTDWYYVLVQLDEMVQ